MFKAKVNKFFSMKKLANLKGAKALNKKEQPSISGGGSGKSCTTICVNAPSGQRCNTHAGCPGVLDGMCDGNGGFYYL